jgi:predicted O-methyltransferase YrrM
MTDLHERVNAYVNDLYAPEDDALRWIQAEAARRGLPSISVQPFEGRLLHMLVLMSGARKVVEIGTLAGYSSVWMARALPAGGKLFTLEMDSSHAAMARESFARAGVSDRVEIREGAALDSLQTLSADTPFDFVFIDADKTGYPAYLEWSIANLRAGGIVAAHNALRDGAVLDPQDDGDHAIAAYNRALANDPRLESYLFAIGDGLTVGVKK